LLAEGRIGQEGAGFASGAGEVGAVGDALADLSRESASVVAEESGRVTASADGVVGVGGASEDTVGEVDAVSGVGADEGRGAAGLALVLLNFVFGTSDGQVLSGDAGVKIFVQEEASGAGSTQVGIFSDGERGNVVGNALVNEVESHTDGLWLGLVVGPGFGNKGSGVGGNTAVALVESSLKTGGGSEIKSTTVTAVIDLKTVGLVAIVGGDQRVSGLTGSTHEGLVDSVNVAGEDLSGGTALVVGSKDESVGAGSTEKVTDGGGGIVCGAVLDALQIANT
jgi:hypothetical protein